MEMNKNIFENFLAMPFVELHELKTMLDFEIHNALDILINLNIVIF